MKTAQLLWQAITPVHVGTGQDSSSVIDLPVAREAGTKYPYIPASSIKGVFRDGEDLDDPDGKPFIVTQARQRFGYADRPASDPSSKETPGTSGIGDLTFTDARILCLPVPSLVGTYALVTCPLVLERMMRDRELLGFTKRNLPSPPDESSAITTNELLSLGGKVILSDLDFTAKVDTGLASFWKDVTGCESDRLCLIPDDAFSFLCETSLQVMAHIRLDPGTKTVKQGALWYEESLPAETLLTSFMISQSGDLTLAYEHPWMQLGGKSTTGQGMMALHVLESEA